MSNNVYVYGLHAVNAVLLKDPQRIITLYLQQDRQDQKIQHVIDTAKHLKISLQFKTKNELDKLSNHEVHQGVMALCHPIKRFHENDLVVFLDELNQPPFLLILDGVQDPHNLGACLRTADAAGVHAVIVPKDKSVSLTATVSKVACGAAETVPFFQVTNLARTLKMLQERGIWIYGAAGEAQKSLYSAKLTGSLAIVLGAEGEGLRRLTKDTCDELLHIPMHGSVSSLNVSVATGVMLFEVVRQNAK